MSDKQCNPAYEQEITLTLEQEPLVQQKTANKFEICGQKDHSRKLIALVEIRKGEVIHNIKPYSRGLKRDFLTVQVNSNEHILDQSLEAMNHSCSPTTYIDCERMQIIAERKIFPGEELTFFYPSTEWTMDRPFKCNCGDLNCLGFVGGAKNLSINQIANWKLNSHIKSQRLSEA